MSLLIGFLTFFMVVNCLFLMLLVLIQLPKKEAGAGIAFGGAATDALFGAGSGNALTNLTKYSAIFFVALSVFISMLNTNQARAGSRRLEQELSRQPRTTAPLTTPLPAAKNPALNVPILPAPITTNLSSSSATTAPAVPQTAGKATAAPQNATPTNVAQPAKTTTTAPAK